MSSLNRSSCPRWTSERSHSDSITSAAHVPSGTPTTASAASSRQPPSNTESWASTSRSTGCSSSQLQSSVADSADCRPEPPCVSRRNRSESPSSSCGGGSCAARPAASSMASGRQSSTRTSSPRISWCSGATPRLRLWNRATASTSGSGESERTCSPASPSGTRLVTRKRASGARARQVSSSPAAWGWICSKLSSTTRQAPRKASACPTRATTSPDDSTPSAAATTLTTPSLLRAGARSQNQALPGRRAARARAWRRARRVLPTPPGPTSVTSGPVTASSSASSELRPMNAPRSGGSPAAGAGAGSERGASAGEASPSSRSTGTVSRTPTRGTVSIIEA
jgi:hypothetical protein